MTFHPDLQRQVWVSHLPCSQGCPSSSSLCWSPYFFKCHVVAARAHGARRGAEGRGTSGEAAARQLLLCCGHYSPRGDAGAWAHNELRAARPAWPCRLTELCLSALT